MNPDKVREDFWKLIRLAMRGRTSITLAGVEFWREGEDWCYSEPTSKWPANLADELVKALS